MSRSAHPAGRLAAAAVLSVSLAAQAPAPPTSPVSPLPERTPQKDPLLEQLIQEALDRNPVLARGRSLAEAEAERISQARALPDPTLSLGIQNDSFKRLEIGTMDSSFYQVMATQPLPWPGKRSLREEVARVGADLARIELRRAGTTLVAEVRRSYVGLLLVRGQRDLLEQQAKFWEAAVAISRARYEAGQGAQVDLLRAQLEQTRLRQSRLGLDAAEQTLLAGLNRLAGRPLDSPLPTSARLEAAPVPRLPVQAWLSRAEKESLDLLEAGLQAKQAERGLALARRERFPDFAVTAGIMPRAPLDPMWQAGFSISLPLWAGKKQKRAVVEQEGRLRASTSGIQAVRDLLAQRIREREAQLDSALEMVRLYREGLLVQSESSFRGSLAQYEAGRSTFLSVLESLNGWMADRSGYLQALAQAHALAIAQEEFNLQGTPGIAAPTLGAGAMGMTAGPAMATASPARTSAPAAGGAGTSPAMSGM
jgi:outer membrane protein TolC